MQIHTVGTNQTLAEISKIYGVDEKTVKINNELGGAPTEGEKLLILTPTRTHTLSAADTPERMLLRFGISKRTLSAYNPQISSAEPKPGDLLIVKYSEPPYGMGVANGSYYKGCSTAMLNRALPYLTYLTLSSAVIDRDGISRIFDDSEALGMAKNADKIPLLRVFEKESNRDYDNEDTRDRLVNELIEFAAERGYKGIVLSKLPSREGVGEFLIQMRKRMIGCDLILFTEVDEGSPEYMSELADGCILSYSKLSRENIPSFEAGERTAFRNFARSCESSKTMIELPAFASCGDSFVPVTEAFDIARRRRRTISNDDNTLLSSFKDGRNEYVFASLDNIKAILDSVSEYGYMGMSFDIMRTPISYLAMYNYLFKPAFYTNVRAREGCSRES